jgi:hypothetical protein
MGQFWAQKWGNIQCKSTMAKQAKTALAADELTVFANRGYYRSCVHDFGKVIDTWPSEAMSENASHTVIIGNEVPIQGGGDGGGTGSIDLISVDDWGELWVIEAKLRGNHQSIPAYVFGNQLMRYAHHLIRLLTQKNPSIWRPGRATRQGATPPGCWPVQDR